MARWLKILLALCLIVFCSITAIWMQFQLIHRKPIRIAINSYSGYEYFVIAREKKFFENAGIKLELIEFGSLEDVQRAFVWGQVDAMVCKLTDVVITKSKTNLDPTVILIPSYPSNKQDTLLLANKNFSNLTQLRGKRIGVELHSWGTYFLKKALRSVNLTLKDVQLVPLDPTEMEHAFKKHIDAAVIYPPHSSNLLQKNEMHQLFSSNQLSKEIVLDVLAVNKKEMNRRLKIWQKIINMWDELLCFKEKYPNETYKIIANHEIISLEESKEIFNTFTPINLERQMYFLRSNKHLKARLDEIQTMFKEMNILNESFSFEEIFDRSLVRKAIFRKNG